jgi:hypothetical protein
MRSERDPAPRTDKLISRQPTGAIGLSVQRRPAVGSEADRSPETSRRYVVIGVLFLSFGVGSRVCRLARSAVSGRSGYTSSIGFCSYLRLDGRPRLI